MDNKNRYAQLEPEELIAMTHRREMPPTDFEVALASRLGSALADIEDLQSEIDRLAEAYQIH